MKYLAAIVLAFLVVACVPPKVILAKGFCVRYEMSWPVAQLPTVQKCVCEEDIYPGLVALLDTFISKPEVITPTGVVLPADCAVKPVPVAPVDPEIKNLLTN
jgi:hypothetical protein